MILFNTTFIIDITSPPEPFLDWARKEYIPAALESPGVAGHTLALIDSPDEATRSYALQLVMAEEAAAAVWETTAEPLRHRLESIYGKGKILWFSTYMDILSHSFRPLDTSI